MKKIFSSVVVVLFAVVYANGQQTEPAQQMTKQDYLQKSKNQKTAAWIFLGSGTALTIGGVAVFWDNFELFSASTNSGEATGIAMTVFGAGAMAGSIPLFIASGRNKRKANETDMALGMKMERAVALQNRGMRSNYFPALSLKINLK